MSPTALPSFPVRVAPAYLGAPPGLGIRPATDGDLGFLRALYEHARAKELAGVPWPTDMLTRFLDDQFALQHRHYLVHHDRADFLVIERGHERVGRLYIDGSGDDLHIVDISLVTGEQGRGTGTRLIRKLMEHAGAQGRGIALHVHRSNTDAERLYRRLGFVHRREPADESMGEKAYLAMRWIS